MATPLVLNDIPLTGTYKSRRNSQFQTILPANLRDEYIKRQEKKDITQCWIYMSKKDNKLILKDNLEKEECPEYNKVNIGLDGKFVARFKDEEKLNKPAIKDLMFKGFYDFIEVSKNLT